MLIILAVTFLHHSYITHFSHIHHFGTIDIKYIIYPYIHSFPFLLQLQPAKKMAGEISISTILQLIITMISSMVSPCFSWSPMRSPRLLGLYILVGALGVPFWALLSQRFDKRRGLVLATLIQQLGRVSVGEMLEMRPVGDMLFIVFCIVFIII